MSTIPNSAMPHAYANDDEDRETDGETTRSEMPTGLLVAGAAVAGYLLYRLVR